MFRQTHATPKECYHLIVYNIPLSHPSSAFISPTSHPARVLDRSLVSSPHTMGGDVSESDPGAAPARPSASSSSEHRSPSYDRKKEGDMVEVLPSVQDGSTSDFDSAPTGPYRMYRRRWFGVFAMVRPFAVEVNCVVLISAGLGSHGLAVGCNWWVVQFILEIVASMSWPWFGPISNNGTCNSDPVYSHYTCPWC